MSKLWSICIPTYNRAECLDINLKLIFEQLNKDNLEKLEILVSNNDSEDNTDNIVKKYINMGMPISYYRNETNIGPDGNFLQCVDKAKGKYVLLLGDDDFLVEGAIDCILSILSENEYGNVYIGNNVKLLGASKNTSTGLKFDNIKLEKFTNPNKYLEYVSYFITFMSGTIFNKCKLDKIISYEKYNKTNLIQLSFYLHAALTSEYNLIIKNTCLMTKSNDNGGYQLVHVFCENFNALLTMFIEKGLSESTIKKINNDLLEEFFPFWLALIRTKKNRFKDEDADGILRRYFSNNMRYWLLIYPVMHLPRVCVSVYVFPLRVLRKVKFLMR